MTLRYPSLLRSAFLVSVAGLALGAGLAHATPNPTSAVINERIFNDDSNSVLTTSNLYPASITIRDAVLDGDGFGSEFANLHNWRFSENGTDAAVFNNNDCFRFGSTLVLSGTGSGEAGLQISPWWSQNVDGRLQVKLSSDPAQDGEIAAFGGRLPFYSFTAVYGIRYVRDTPIHLEMVYDPNSLSQADPGTIEYRVTYNSTLYTSGPLPFDEGNAAEGRGTWGILDDARVGGHIQPLIQVGNPNTNLQADWRGITFEACPVPTLPTTWGRIKADYR